MLKMSLQCIDAHPVARIADRRGPISFNGRWPKPALAMQQSAHAAGESQWRRCRYGTPVRGAEVGHGRRDRCRRVRCRRRGVWTKKSYSVSSRPLRSGEQKAATAERSPVHARPRRRRRVRPARRRRRAAADPRTSARLPPSADGWRRRTLGRDRAAFAVQPVIMQAGYGAALKGGTWRKRARSAR